MAKLKVAPCSLVLVISLLYSAWGLAGTINTVTLCVDNEKFDFSVQITETQPTDIIFRIGADGSPFVSPLERIAFNFDSVTGAITDHSPVVETFGITAFDRWEDGPVTDLSITAVSAGVWNIVGSVSVGKSRFQPGDSIWGVALRTDTTVFSGAVAIDACGPIIPGSLRGKKWQDNDGNGVQDSGEPGLPGVTIYLDLNNNAVLDAEEPVTITVSDDSATADDESGWYEFNGLDPADYVVREVVPSGFVQVFPVSGSHVVTVESDANVEGIDFGNQPEGTGADLALNVSETPITVDAGDTVNFTVLVSNNGPENATAVLVRASFTGPVIADAFPFECGFDGASSTVFCGFANLLSGQTEQLSFSMRFPDGGDQFLNYTLSADQDDPALDNNTASVLIRVQGSSGANLAAGISILSGGNELGQVRQDTEITLRAWAANHGPNPATGVSANIRISAQFTVLDYEPVCTLSTGFLFHILNCSLPDMLAPPHPIFPTVAAIQFRVLIPERDPLFFGADFSVNVSANESDPVLDNNSASLMLDIRALAPDLTIRLSNREAEPELVTGPTGEQLIRLKKGYVIFNSIPGDNSFNQTLRIIISSDEGISNFNGVANLKTGDEMQCSQQQNFLAQEFICVYADGENFMFDNAIQSLFLSFDVDKFGDYEIKTTIRVGEDEMDPDLSNNTIEHTLTAVLTPVEVRALEVTQAIQTWENSVRLSEHHRTVVRGFIQRTNNGDHPFVAKLYGRRNGIILSGSPLNATNSGSAVVPTEDAATERKNKNGNYVFSLPRNWTTGTVELELDVQSGIVPLICNEPISDGGTDPAGNCKVTVSFEPATEQPVRFYFTGYRENKDPNVAVTEPTPAEMLEQIERLRTLFPFPMDIEYGHTIVTKWDDERSRPSAGEAKKHLSRMRWFETHGCSFLGCAVPRYYGVLAGFNPTSTIGVANIGGGQATHFLRDTGSDLYTGRLRNVIGQELAHTLALHHAVDAGLPLNDDGKQIGPCSATAPATYPAHLYYYETSTGKSRPALGPTGDDDNKQAWGFDARFAYNDIANLNIISPFKTWAVMSYCRGGNQSTWSSIPTWESLFDAPTPQPATSTSNAESSLLVFGSIDVDTGAATIDPVSEAEGPPLDESESEAPKSHRVSLIGFDGLEIAGVDIAIEVVGLHGVQDPELSVEKVSPSFVASLPKPDQPIAAVVVSDANGEIGRRNASANPPVVNIIAPANGELLDTDQVTLAWTASDPDGDTLTYDILYSADDGNSWEALTVVYSDQSITLNREALAATNAGRLRVIASDGVHTAVAESSSFAVADNPPFIKINQPVQGSFYSGDQLLPLDVVGFDPDLGALEGLQIVWSSDLNGEIATGNRPELLASELFPGRHTLTVTTIGPGLTTEEQVEIVILVEHPGIYSDDDADGLTILEEAEFFTDPTNPDSDGDDIIDGLDTSWVVNVVDFFDADVFRTEGNHRAINAQLADFEDAIREQDQEAAEEGLDNLTRHANGCASNAEVADKNDWLLDCEAQTSLGRLLDILRRNLNLVSS